MSTVDGKIFCDECGCLIEDTEYGIYEGTRDRVYCEDCAGHMPICHNCGLYLNTDDELHTVYTRSRRGNDYTSEYMLCDDCFSNADITQCDCCHEWYDEYLDLTCIDGEHICDDCLEQDYCQCERCGRWIYAETANYHEGDNYCDECYHEIKNGVIWGYHDYPGNWQFYGREDELHFGIELEIEGGGEDSRNAVAITKAMGFPANEDNMLICSHDGSLCNGFEIITQPCTYAYLINNINWEAGLAKARELGYVSHNGGHCGLHVHTDTGYFLNNGYKSHYNLEDVVSALLLMNGTWMKQFCRRDEWGFCNFPTYAEINHLPLSPRLTFRSIGRYAAVNFLPYTTMEFRFMRGTLIYPTFKAALQLMSLIGKAVAIYKTVDSIRDIYFPWFLDAADKLGYSEFIKEYFKRCTGLEVENPAHPMVF